MTFTPKRPRFGIWRIQNLGQDPRTGEVYTYTPPLRQFLERQVRNQNLKLIFGSISLSGWVAAAAAWYPLLKQPDCVNDANMRQSSQYIGGGGEKHGQPDITLKALYSTRNVAAIPLVFPCGISHESSETCPVQASWLYQSSHP